MAQYLFQLLKLYSDMSDLKMKVLGCGDAFCSGGRFNSAFYFTSDHINFLLDCGATTLLALKQHHIKTSDIDAVIISHFHGDHFGGLIFLLLEEKKNNRKKPFYIISPIGMDEKLKSTVSLFYQGSDILEELDIKYIFYGSHQKFEFGGLTFNTFPVVHAEDSLPHGIRIDINGVIVAYSGDTEWTDELIALSEGADLFICECNFYDVAMKGHLSYKELKSHSLNYKKILLTHLGEDMLQNLPNIEYEVAEDGKEYIITKS